MHGVRGGALMAVRMMSDGRWVCYWRRDGKWHKEYFGRGVEAERRAWQRNDELRFADRRPPREDYGPAFVELSEEYMRAKGFAPRPLELLGVRLGANLLPHFGALPAVRITDKDVDAYVAKRREDGVMDATIRRELTDLKAIMSWASQRKLIPLNPIRDYKKPPDALPASLRPPTDEEAALIFAHASPHLLRALKLAWRLGLRPGAVELLRLTWEESVNWTSRTILVISARKGGPGARAVPIHPNFVEELKAWQAADGGKGPLVHYRGKPIRCLNNTWWGTLERAKIPRSRGLRMYDFRHRFVTSALEHGADMKALAEVVGSRPETLMRFYQHVSRDIHRQTIERVPDPPEPAVKSPDPPAPAVKPGRKVIPLPRRASR